MLCFENRYLDKSYTVEREQKLSRHFKLLHLIAFFQDYEDNQNTKGLLYYNVIMFIKKKNL